MSCCIPSCGSSKSSDDESGNEDVDLTSSPLVWCRDIEKHSCGDFSCAAIQANTDMEDACQVETGSNAIFAGVYDGHCGPDTAVFVRDKFFQHLIKITKELGTFSNDVLKRAVAATEDQFLTRAEKRHKRHPSMAIHGSCCLVGVIWKETLYIANVGDSRAVIGSIDTSLNRITAEQLTTEHNVNRKEVREELWAAHRPDASICFWKNGSWRVKGVIKVSRSIGDAFLKWPGFTVDPSLPRWLRLPAPISQPVLTAEPFLYSRVLQPNDRFLIFASDGLWDDLSNEQAVEIVHSNPREGIAKRLLEAALKKVARRKRMEYKELHKIEKGIRRHYHDDITVIVVFIDHELLGTKDTTVPELSFKGFVDSVGPSDFTSIQELM